MSSENEQIAQMTEEINRLRRERQAIILVHTYQTPEV